MASSQRFLNPITLSVAFILTCAFVPLFYDARCNVRLFCHDFSVDGYLGWFLRDLCYVLGWVFYGYIALIKDTVMRETLAKIFIVDAGREFIDLVVWNNEYGPWGLVLNTIFVLGAIVYAWKKLRP